MITGDLPQSEAIKAALDIMETAAMEIIAGPDGFAVRSDSNGLCIFTEERLIFAAMIEEVRFDD